MVEGWDSLFKFILDNVKDGGTVRDALLGMYRETKLAHADMMERWMVDRLTPVLPR